MGAFFENHILLRFDLFGASIGLPVLLVVQWSVMAVVFLYVFLARRNAKPTPGVLQNFSEILAATLKRWTSRRTAADGPKAARRPPSESLSAAVVTAGLFIFTFWAAAAVTTLPIQNGPMSAIVGVVNPVFQALKEKTILGPVLERFNATDIGEEIRDAIQFREAFGVQLFGFRIGIADVVVVTWLVMGVLFLLSFWLGRGFRPVPKGKQLIAENLVKGIQSLVGTVMEPDLVDRYVPFVGTIVLFISFCNMTAVFRLPPPAKNPIFPAALALLAIASVLFFSIREVGFRGFARSMLYPKVIMLPFKIIDFIIKIISLSLRLFGNIFGAFILMEFVNIVAPILLPGLIGLWFDLADGLIQGLVFGYLTALYIGEVVENAHHAAQSG